MIRVSPDDPMVTMPCIDCGKPAWVSGTSVEKLPDGSEERLKLWDAFCMPCKIIKHRKLLPSRCVDRTRARPQLTP